MESTGRCCERRRSPEVKLFHYERTRVVFIHSLLLRSRGGLRGEWRRILNPSGKKADYKPSPVSLITAGDPAAHTHRGGGKEGRKRRRRRRGTKKVAGEITQVPNDQESALPPRLGNNKGSGERGVGHDNTRRQDSGTHCKPLKTTVSTEACSGSNDLT